MQILWTALDGIKRNKTALNWYKIVGLLRIGRNSRGRLISIDLLRLPINSYQILHRYESVSTVKPLSILNHYKLLKPVDIQ